MRRTTIVLSRVEGLLKDNGALKDLQRLIAEGCNHAELLFFLEYSFLLPKSWDALVGTNLRAFKGKLQEIRDCADIIEGLNRSELTYCASFELRHPRFAALQQASMLPDRLREYADTLDLLRRVFGPKRRLRLHFWKAWIVAMVITDTKNPHDREVSALISAVLQDHEYFEKAHQQWRRKNRDLIETMERVLREYRHSRTPPPPPSMQ